MAKSNEGRKRGYTYCEACKRGFKNAKAKAKHSCKVKANKEENKSPCKICGAKKEERKLEAHIKACQFRYFKVFVWPILHFFYRIVASFNLGIKNLNFLGGKREKEILLKKTLRKVRARTTFGYTPSASTRRNFFQRILARKYEEATRLARAAFPHNPQENLIKFISEIENDLHPSISARQIIYDYFKERQIYDERIYNFIDNKLKKKDYPTDNEIDVGGEEIPTKLAVLRDAYDYKDDYKELRSKLEWVIANNKEIRCPYCKKFVQMQKRHYLNCKIAEGEYYKDKNEFMSKYIRRFFDPLKLKEAEAEDAIFYFKNYNYETFLKKIGKYFISHKKTINEIEINKEKNNENNNKIIKKYTGKMFMEEFLNEYNNENKKINEENKPGEVKDDENEEVDTCTASLKYRFLTKKDNVLVYNSPKKNTIKKDENIEKIGTKIEGNGLIFLKNNIKNPLNKKKHIKIKFINH